MTHMKYCHRSLNHEWSDPDYDKKGEPQRCIRCGAMRFYPSRCDCLLTNCKTCFPSGVENDL